MQPDLQPGALHDGAGGGVRRAARRAIRSSSCALKPAEDLTDDEREFLLQHSFHADPQRMIYRYPRYGELFDALAAPRPERRRARSMFGAQELRDLQMLSQLAWFDEEFQADDRGGARAGSSAAATSRCDDQAPHGRKAARDPGPGAAGLRAARRRRADRDLHHAVLPSDPAAALRFQHRRRLASRRAAAAALPLSATMRAGNCEMARDYVEQQFGVAPVGLWPSEGSVSDEVFALAARTGLRVGRHRQRRARPHARQRARRRGRTLPALRLAAGRHAACALIFRDHFLSDLIGFVYSQMDAAAGGRRFPAPHPRELPRHSGQRPRRAGAHHSRRRERLGILSTRTAARSCASSTGASPTTRA